MAPSEESEYEQIWVSRDQHRLGIRRYSFQEPQGEVPQAGQHQQRTRGPDSAVPSMLLLPAMGVPAGYYGPLIRRLRELGIRVAAMDLRGTGSSEPRPSRRDRYGYAEMVDDLTAVLDELVPDPARDRVVLLGHSMGGHLGVLHQATTDDKRVAGLALVASGLPYWRVYRGWRPLGVLPVTQAIGAAAAVLGVWPGWGFGGRQANGVIRDWAYIARTGRFPTLDGRDVTEPLRQLRTPVLAVSLEHDQLTPSPTVDLLCGYLDSAPVERTHYPAAVTGKLDHFGWARTPGPIADRLAEFARTVMAG